MSATFNMFDLVFLVASLIFIVVAFFRGFVKELFSLINWIITIFLTYLLCPFVAKFIEHYSHNKLIINVASSSIVFVLVFIIAFFATRGLANDWKDKMSENTDRILGLFFGIFKSLLIFGLFYSVLLNFYSTLLGDVEIADEKASSKKSHHVTKEEENLPQWLLDAQSFSIMRFSGKLIDPLVSSAIDGATKNLFEDIKLDRDELDKKIDEKKRKKGVSDEAGGSSGALADDKNPQDTGYSKKDIEKMNKLIDNVR